MDNNIIHITLIGGQSMPVYLAVKKSQAKRFILIHSSSTTKVAEKLEKDILSDTADATVKLVEIDPVDFFKAKEQLNAILQKCGDSLVEVNISSGTKPWSIAAAVLSEQYKNIELIYVDQSSRIYNYKSAKCFEFGLLGISDIFKYNQTEVQSYTKLDDYTEDDLAQLTKIKDVRRRYHRQFNALTIPQKNNKARYDNDVDAIEDPDTGSVIRWDKRYFKEVASLKQQRVHFSIANKYVREREEVDIISPHAFDLVKSSGWFEYEVAVLLNKWSACLEVWLNVIFPYSTRSPKNEIDIIVNTGRKLLFVECKTQLFDNTDIDKFAAAVKNYGGMGAKAIFITQENMRQQAVEKCETNKIAHYSLYDERRAPRGEEALFKLLDDIIAENNAR